MPLPHFKPTDELNAAAFDKLIDEINAARNITVAPAANAPVRVLTSPTNTLFDFKEGAGASLPILVCTEDGPALVEVLVKSASVPVDDE